MKTLLKTSLVSAFAALTFAPVLPANIVGSGKVVSETRNVTGFHGVDLRCSGSVIVTQGDADGLVIDAEDNILPVIETSVTGDGTLRIAFKSHEDIHLNKPVIFKVAVKALTTATISGSGSITTKALKTDRLGLEIMGSGDIIFSGLEADALTVSISGSGTVKTAGKAKTQTIDINGSGDYEGASLKTGATTVTIAGSGDCEVAASDTLAITSSGSGDVTYYGTPTVTKHVTGTGDVEGLGSAQK